MHNLHRQAVATVGGVCAVVLVACVVVANTPSRAILQQQTIGFNTYDGAPYKTGPHGEKVYDVPHVGGTNGVYMGANGGGLGFARAQHSQRRVMMQQHAPMMQQQRPAAGPGPPYPPPGPSWDGVPARQLPRHQTQLGELHQPGYNPASPKGLWGKGVPLEFRQQDYELVKSLATVESDLKTDEAMMASVQAAIAGSNVARGAATSQAMRTAAGQQLAVGGVDIEGGQGEADSLFGSHDDHSTYGVAGSGWQGTGNGENPGELWNPAVAAHMNYGQQLRMMQGRQRNLRQSSKLQ